MGKQALAELPHIIPLPGAIHPFDDDLSFNADEPGYQALKAALQWNIQRSSRSGRVAWQFAKDHAGRLE